MKARTYREPSPAIASLNGRCSAALFHGDCKKLLQKMPDRSVDLVVTSPPYCMGKAYERSDSFEEFVRAHERILPEIVRITKDGGSICWQVGYHVSSGVVMPLDFAVFQILCRLPGITLRNRIVWSFGHGLHSTHAFSGRHEMVLWFTKGSAYHFDLDAVRVPQKYPGKRHYKGPKKGLFSCNPRGKNPGNVWEIPNVKRNHVEKLDHPCQFPVALAERLVLALCPSGGIVFDPYSGTATTGVAAVLNGRRFLGSEIQQKYVQIGQERLVAAINRTVQFRPISKPIAQPNTGHSVARVPVRPIFYHDKAI